MAATRDYDVLVRIALVGDRESGMTSLMKRLCQGDFLEVAVDVVDFMARTLDSPATGQRVKIQLWHPLWRHHYIQMRSPYYKRVNCYVVTVDSTKRSTLDRLLAWLHEIERK